MGITGNGGLPIAGCCQKIDYGEPSQLNGTLIFPERDTSGDTLSGGIVIWILNVSTGDTLIGSTKTYDPEYIAANSSHSAPSHYHYLLSTGYNESFQPEILVMQSYSVRIPDSETLTFNLQLDGSTSRDLILYFHRETRRVVEDRKACFDGYDYHVLVFDSATYEGEHATVTTGQTLQYYSEVPTVSILDIICYE